MPKRRDVLKAGAAAVATTPALFGGAMIPRTANAQLCRPEGIRNPTTEPDSPAVAPYTTPLFIPQAMPGGAEPTPAPDPANHQRLGDFPPAVFYEQHMIEGLWDYHPTLSALNTVLVPPGETAGTGSIAWLFRTDVDGVQGTPSTPGDTMVAHYGQPIFLRRFNDLPATEDALMPIGLPYTTTHLHNAHTESQSDGYPEDFIGPGETWDHHYAMYLARNDSREALGSLWYHDHMLDFTATNVYAGLSAMAIFYDAIDSGDENDTNAGALRLPSGYGQYDITLILHDVRFDEQGNPAYNIFDTDGHLGDLVTVNRKVMPYMQVKRRKYRFRIYDGGPSRLYELVLGNGDNMVVIANDGNLLEHPVEVSSIVLGPANRHDVIIDFSQYADNTDIELLNVMEQINGQGPTGRRLDTADAQKVMQFQVRGPIVSDPSQVPDNLRELPDINLNEVVAEREWIFDHDMGLWTVNHEFMDPTKVSAHITENTAEVWTFRNAGTSWAHPVHVHFEEFQILEWNGKPPTGVLKSRKDVATLGPGDVVKVFYRFSDFLGRYVIHCHNNVHEDNAMMARWDIESA